MMVAVTVPRCQGNRRLGGSTVTAPRFKLPVTVPLLGQAGSRGPGHILQGTLRLLDNFPDELVIPWESRRRRYGAV